jgi:threonylcarbamoyladenosine tRNA methylthiotransferase MtaB
VRRVAGIEGLWRVRLSSLEPLDLTPELLAVCRGEKVAPHFHLPLQSGSAKVLARMNRQYAPQQYRRTVDRLREAIDRVAITTDIIVGFPGEDDEDFRQTLDLARFAGFSRIHAFPFSAIEGTAAWNWRKQAPPPAVVKARLAELAEVQEQLSRQFRRQFLGETMEGIVERTSRSRIGATTDRHITITAHRPTAGDDLRGQVVRVRAESLSEDGLEGRLLQPSERV